MKAEGATRILAATDGKVVIAHMRVDKGEAVAGTIGGVFVKRVVTHEAGGQAVVVAALKRVKLAGLVGIAPAEKGAPPG